MALCALVGIIAAIAEYDNRGVFIGCILLLALGAIDELYKLYDD